MTNFIQNPIFLNPSFTVIITLYTYYYYYIFLLLLFIYHLLYFILFIPYPTNLF